MSAFICSDRHIATIAHFVANGNLESAQLIADNLKRENIRSVNYRYNEKTRAKPCDISDYWKEASINDLVCLVHCLDYQSCERPDYDVVLLRTIESLLLRFGANPAKSEIWSI